MTASELEAARRLVELYDERVRLTRELAASDRPTGAMVQAVFDVDDETHRGVRGVPPSVLPAPAPCDRRLSQRDGGVQDGPQYHSGLRRDGALRNT